MTQFDTNYRQAVNDANSGKLQASIPQVSTVSRSGQSVGEEKLDTRSKFSGFSELAGAIGSAATGIAKRRDQEALETAYAEGTQEKLDELNKGGSRMLRAIFGDSPELKGFQRRVIDNEVEQDYQNRLSTIAEDAQKYTSLQEYRKNVGDPLLKAALEKQSDPTVQAAITKQFTANSKLLSGQFSKHRKIYDAVLNRKQVLTNVITASQTMNAAAISGDDTVLDDARSRLGKALQRPRGMDAQAWEDTLTNAVVDRIGNNDLGILQVLESQNKTTFFSINNKNKLQLAKDVYTRENDTRFLTKDLDLQQQIATQDSNFETSLAAYKKQYPQVDVSKYRKAFTSEQQKQEAAALQLHNDKLDILSGTTPAAPKDSQRKAAAFRAAEDHLANDAAMAAKGERIRNQLLQGEQPENLNAVPTQEAKDAAIMAAPQGLVNMWRTSGAAPTLAIKSLHELDSMILSDSLDVDDEARVEQLTQFLSHFNENPNDQALFAKGVKSKEQLANYKQLDFLMNKTGKATRKSLVMMRLNKDKPVPEFDPIQSQQFANEALREFTDNNGFENWLGWSTNPDNQQDLELAAADAFEEALAIVKNPAQAKNLVQDFLTFDSTQVGDKFVLGGADLDTNSYGGSYNDYVQAVQVSDQWQSKQFAAGFPRDRLITDERNTITVFPNGQGAVITSFDRHGNTIYVDLPSPANQHDWPSTQPERRETEELDFNEPVPEPDTGIPNNTDEPNRPVAQAEVPESSDIVTTTANEEHPANYVSKLQQNDDGTIGSGKANRNGKSYPYMFEVKGKGWEVDIGYGTLIKHSMSKSEAEALVKSTPAQTIGESRKQLKAHLAKDASKVKKDYPKLAKTKQDALALMLYQGGGNLDVTKWPNTNESIQKAINSDSGADWLQVQKNLLNSKWAKQTPERAMRVAKIFKPSTTKETLQGFLRK